MAYQLTQLPSSMKMVSFVVNQKKILMLLQKYYTTSDQIKPYIFDYILRYTVSNSTSLGNVAFRWFTNGLMQLASGFMQLEAAGRRRCILDFHCLFEGKMLSVHWKGETFFKIVICGGTYRRMYIRKSFISETETQFLTVYLMKSILECSWNHEYFGSLAKELKRLHIKFAGDPKYS